MATPKRRISHSRTHNRKSQWLGSLTSPSLTACPHCGEMIETYHACPACGYYKGRQVIKIAEGKEEKKD